MSSAVSFHEHNIMIRISRFNLEEYTDIFQILKEVSIPFETKTETISIGRMGGYHEYYIFVSREDLHETIKLIKEYFGIIETSLDPFSGVCPACGFTVSNEMECPDCELSFSLQPIKLEKGHAFLQFLKEYENG